MGGVPCFCMGLPFLVFHPCLIPTRGVETDVYLRVTVVVTRESLTGRTLAKRYCNTVAGAWSITVLPEIICEAAAVQHGQNLEEYGSTKKRKTDNPHIGSKCPL